MTEPEIPLLSGTSIVEGMAKAIQKIPKDKRHELEFLFEVQKKQSNPAEFTAKLIYTYKETFDATGYVTGTINGDIKAGGQVNWNW